MEKIKTLFQKYKSLIMYAIFGGLTTLVNMAAYSLCFSVIGISNVPSVIIAWFLAVCFAFITNKLWVFESKSFSAEVLRHELPTFFGARIATGLMDVGIMYLAVDVLQGNPTVWKLISNILVIIINYIASKLLIFKRPASQEEPRE
jgi:putative flippase GtrA